MENKTTKIIITPQVARYLLKSGFQIVDIKPNKKEEGKSIFVFKIEHGLTECILRYMKEKKKSISNN